MIKNIPNEPILEFESQEQANTYLKGWQSRLFLDDWIITLNFADYRDMPEVGDAGYCNFQMVNKCAAITLCNSDGAKGGIAKFCQEKVLVHELLHCIYNFAGYNTESYDSRYRDTMQHQQIELMARSLIMAKYDIGPEWFRNLD